MNKEHEAEPFLMQPKPYNFPKCNVPVDARGLSLNPDALADFGEEADKEAFRLALSP